MATIDDLCTSITEVDRKTAMSLIMERRFQRRTLFTKSLEKRRGGGKKKETTAKANKRKAKAPKLSLKEQVALMSPADKAKFLAELTGGK